MMTRALLFLFALALNSCNTINESTELTCFDESSKVPCMALEATINLRSHDIENSFGETAIHDSNQGKIIREVIANHETGLATFRQNLTATHYNAKTQSFNLKLPRSLNIPCSAKDKIHCSHTLLLKHPKLINDQLIVEIPIDKKHHNGFSPKIHIDFIVDSEKPSCTNQQCTAYIKPATIKVFDHSNRQMKVIDF